MNPKELQELIDANQPGTTYLLLLAVYQFATAAIGYILVYKCAGWEVALGILLIQISARSSINSRS